MSGLRAAMLPSFGLTKIGMQTVTSLLRLIECLSHLRSWDTVGTERMLACIIIIFRIYFYLPAKKPQPWWPQAVMTSGILFVILWLRRTSISSSPSVCRLSTLCLVPPPGSWVRTAGCASLSGASGSLGVFFSWQVAGAWEPQTADAHPVPLRLLPSQ